MNSTKAPAISAGALLFPQYFGGELILVLACGAVVCFCQTWMRIMTLEFKIGVVTKHFSCTAKKFCLMLVVGGCVSTPSQQWAAHGFLSPGATGDSELIGVFEKKMECEAAAEGWMSRQVVGNPVSAECLPVDRD